MARIIFQEEIEPEEIVKETKDVLMSGGVAILPTDTVPGIGCCATNHKAVARLFRLKERPAGLPVPVILGDSDDLKHYAKELPPVFHRLAGRYWPGALTIVVKSNGKIDKGVGGGKDNLGFRVPDYVLLRDIVKAVDCPLALTSANPHDKEPSALYTMLIEWWNDLVDLIVLGPSKAAPPAPSAVVDITVKPPKVLREGTLDLDELTEILED